MKYVGLDIHKEYCDTTVLDELGMVMKKGRFQYTREPSRRDRYPGPGMRAPALHANREREGHGLGG